MAWLIYLLALTAFERQGDRTVFFPYGDCWAGYEYTSDLRTQLMPLLITFAGFGTLLLIAYQSLLSDHDGSSATDIIYPEAILLFCFYALGVSAITRGLPKIYCNLDGAAASLKLVRFFPVWLLYTLLPTSILMTLGGIFVAVAAIRKGGDWLAASQSAVFFAVGIPVFIGLLRLRRRLQRRPALA